MKPTPFMVFCGYYLGLDLEFRYRFFNIRSLASHFEMDPGDLKTMMDEMHLAPEDTRHVDYNIAKAHVTAQELAESGQRLDVESFARKTFEEFGQAMSGYDPNRDFDDVDYDDILDIKKRG